MQKKQLLGSVVLGLLLAAAATYLTLGTRMRSTPHDAIERADFTLPDLEGRIRKASEWDGQVVLLNFWAPWCPPCRNEIPTFIELQEDYGGQGLTIVGITIDTHENAQTFADTMGINYPILVGEEKGVAIAQAYGNRVGALPYTAIIDREGRVRFSRGGELSYEQAMEMIRPLL